MLTYYEERRRSYLGDLYKVRSWYFCGVLVYRRWEQLTTHNPMPSEMG